MTTCWTHWKRWETMTNPERNVRIDEDTYYDLRSLGEEIEDGLEEFQSEVDEATFLLMERAAGLFRELVWKYEESQSVEANSPEDN